MVAKPKKDFRVWLNHLISTLDITLPLNAVKPDDLDLYLDSPLFLVPAFTDMADYDHYIEKHYQAIFINCLYLWCQNTELWPKEFPDKFTYTIFQQYFDLELHSRLYDMTEMDKR